MRKIKIVIETGNDAFMSFQNAEVAQILQRISNEVLLGSKYAEEGTYNILDSNGNTCGEVKIK